MKRHRPGLALAAFLLAASAGASGELPFGSLYLEPLRWTDDSEAAVELASFRGQTVALTMFYTECSSACPITLAKLREIEKAFAERGRDLQIVLVSYDSRHDTPRRLARFRRRETLLGERWHLLSGSQPSVERLARRLGLGSYVDVGEHIVHSFRIVLLDEDGVVRKTLDAKHDKVASLFDVPVPASRAR
jgi:protein SCO1/2